MKLLNAQPLRAGLHRAAVALILLGGIAFPAHAQLGVVPDITVQPLGQTVPVGGTAVFTVDAFSLTTMSYQWFRNSNAIPGATASTYTRPNVNFPDAGFFHVVIQNFIGSTKSDVVPLVVVSNAVPVGVNDAFITAEETALAVAAPGILANDTDADSGTVLRALLVTNVARGTLSFSTNGNFTYTPSNNYAGPDSFSYRPRDGVSTGNVTTVNITVTPVNDPPVAGNDSTNTVEDTSVTIRVLRNDIDVDSPITLTGTSTTNGTAVISGTNIVFTPATNFSGTAVFSYTISDGTDSATGSVTVAVSAVNDSPITVNDTYSTSEDMVLTIPAAAGLLTNDLDVDNASLTAVLVASPSRGTLTLNANGSFTYTPTLNLHGPDSFTYRARDGTVNGNLGTVTINVTPVNDVPVAGNDSTNTLEDTSVTIRVLRNDSDVEGPLTIASTSTTNGTAIISGTNIVFTPALNYFGSVVFSYVLSDGTNSVSANVSVNVNSVNDAPPVAANDTFATSEDLGVTVAAPGVLGNDADVDGDSFTALLVSSVTAGTLSFNANGSFSYAPNTNFNGLDSFTYRTTDGMATGNVATVTINVTAVNDPPVARGDATNTLEDTSVTIDVLGNDSDLENDLLLITGISTTNGTVLVQGGTALVFTPATNFYGTAVFNYTISDGGYTATSSVTVTVISVNDAPPVANNESYSTVEDTPLTIGTLGILNNDLDVDFDPVSALLVNTTIRGTLSLNANGSFTYTPNSNYFGSDSFTYRATDGMATGNTATVTITITSVNDVPLPGNDMTNTLEDTSVIISVLANDIEIENSALAITSTSTTNGTALISGTNIVFTPSTNFNGTADLSYTVSDGTNSATSSVAVTVVPVNDVPIAVDDAISTLEDKSVTINVLANDSDVERAALTVTSVSSSNGTAVISGTNIVYTPPANYFGTALLDYTISDGTNSVTAGVTVTITPVNDAPVASDDSYSTAEDIRLTISAPGVLANDTDVENDVLTALLVSGVSHGSLSFNGNGAFIYTPETNYFGEDSFTYRIWDGSSNSVATTVRLVTHLTTPLKIVSGNIVTNGFKLGLVGPTPAAYTILASSNNLDWKPLGSRVAWNGPVEFTDTNANRTQNCFYAATVGSQATIVLEQNATGGDKVDLRSDKQGSQSFRHGVAGDPSYTVSKVVLRLSRQPTLPNANLIFTIGTGINTGALPYSTVVINPASISNTSAGNNFQTYEILFTVPIGPLAAGTTYYLNFEYRPTNGARMYLESAGTDSAYPQGQYYRGGNVEGDDAVFELWGQ